jgi:hypothetical protein
MSLNANFNRYNSTDKEETENEKISITKLQTNKSQIENSKTISKNNNYEKSNINNNNNIEGKEYTYPILYHKERDPLDEFKLRIIKSKSETTDIFNKNYLKFNFSKNDASVFNNTKIIQTKMTQNNSKMNSLENSKNNNLFITANKKLDVKGENVQKKKNKKLNDNSNNKQKRFKTHFIFNKNQIMKKSNSDIFVKPYSKEALSNYRTSYLHEMEKRGNMYNKIKIAQLQRIALKNFSAMCINGNHYINGSIPTGKSNESYILETKKRKRLPGIKEYICSKLKSMKNEEYNTPEYYRERSKKYERNKLPEIINIKNSGRFQFHVFRDQYGFKKQLDKKATPELKMTKEKVRDLKVMAKINMIKDPEIIDIYKRAVYSS